MAEIVEELDAVAGLTTPELKLLQVSLPLN
jgi:hypothetical protein